MKPDDLPKTVDEAVDQIISEMTFEERVQVARLSKEQLAPFNYLNEPG